MSKSEQAQEAGAAATPPTLRPRDIMLLDFLREHDADCPVCGYNLLALTRPMCPECGQELALTVGATRLRLGWLFTAVAPGFFSGIAAIFFLVPIIGRAVFGDGVWMPLAIAVDLFGWCSGVFAIILAFRGRHRNRFLAQSRAWQRWFALTTWLIHIAALGLFILIGAVSF